MKKIFTLILMALAIVTGAKAQATEDIDISSGWGWGYNSTTTYEDGVMTITLTDGYGAGSIGWGSGANWSKYNKLTVVIDSYTNDWGKVYFTSTEKESETSDNHVTIAEQSFSTITSQTEVVVNFDPTKATSVYQLSIQGKAADDVIKVSRVYLTEAVSYEEKELTLTDGIHILSSEFDAYDDANEVKLTFANTTNPYASRDGWGIGDITNIDNWGTAPAGNYKVHLQGKAGTEFTIFTTVGELKKVAKNNGDDYIESEYNRTGVSISVYNDCSLVKATVLIPQSDSPSFSAVTLSSTLSGTNENIPVVANGEELFADLSDEATNDFVINSITITPVGSFQHVQGKLRLTSEDGNTQIEPKSGGFYTVPFTYDSTDDVWKAEDLDIKLAGGDLDLDANTNYILEFYFEGSTDGNIYDYTYKNGENNFKVKFQNGTPPVQFKDTETADVVFKVDGTEKTVTINKDGSAFSNNANLGELSDLKVKGFQIKGYNQVELTSGYANLQAIIQETANAENTSNEIGGMRSKDEDLTVFNSTHNFFIKTTFEDIDIIDIIKTAKEAGLTLKHNTQYTMKFYYAAVLNGKHYFVPNKENGEYAEVTFTYTDKITGVEITLNTPTAGTYETHDLLEDDVDPVNIGPAEVFNITNLDVATAGLAITGVKLRYITHDNGVPDNQIKEIALTNNYGTWSLDDEMNVFDEIGAQPMHKYKIEYWIEASVEGDSETLKWNNGGENYIVGVEVDDGTSGFKETYITVTTADTPETIELTDDMTTPMSYNDVEKFVVNNITTTTYGNVSGVKLCYRIYTNGSWDGISTFNLPLTDDGFGTWQTLGSHDFVDDHNWTPGINYTIVFWFEGYDETNNETIKWDNSGNRYEVDITVKDTSTGINGIEGDEADAKADAYNIAGQKVGKNYKGIVIKNGKKQIVK